VTRSHIAAFGIVEWSYGEGGDKNNIIIITYTMFIGSSENQFTNVLMHKIRDVKVLGMDLWLVNV